MSDETQNDDEAVTEPTGGASAPVEVEPGHVDSEDFEQEIADEAAHAGEEPERLYTRLEFDETMAAERDRQLRIMAEYDNFRRRTAREKEQWIADALERFITDLLPVFDSFDKARETETDDAAAVLEGLDVMYRQLLAAFGAHRVDVIDPVGEPFDPKFHEALTRMPSPDHEPNTVVQVFEKGYAIGGRLVRAARVAVSADG